jgi:hypothetical protein
MFTEFSIVSTVASDVISIALIVSWITVADVSSVKALAAVSAISLAISSAVVFTTVPAVTCAINSREFQNIVLDN